MAQTDKTPIQFYRSSTGGTTPDSANLSAGELAINTADVAIYTENSSGVVKRLINNPAGLKYPTADGTASQVLVTDGSGNLSFAAPTSGTVYQAVASGSLSNGTTVIINSDGTVSAVTQTISTLNPPTAGTPVVFESASSDYLSAIYDTTNQKVVIAYVDADNLNYGTAIVGTVSGTSISFGTAVVFSNSGTEFVSATYDNVNQKVVIAYKNTGNSNRGTAIVGTVSGTSISFGTPVVFQSSRSDAISATYDTTNQKVVIAYSNVGNSGYGTAVVGTVSGTSISFGTPVVFQSANSVYVSATYDSTNQKVVIVYRNIGNSNFGTAVVGTVSGTSVSFGTSAVFNSARSDFTAVTYDSNAQKVVIVYSDFGNSGFGTAVVGTVSGTSISFGSGSVFASVSTEFIAPIYNPNIQKIVIAYKNNSTPNGSAIVGTVSGTSISFGTAVVFASVNANSVSATYDTTNQKVVTVYRNIDNSNFGTAVVITTQTSSTNLTSENYIGISDGAYTNGQTANIQTVGSVDDAQSSLVAGQAYYVQQNGTLSQTPDSPSVFAGTAVSSTKLIIKG